MPGPPSPDTRFRSTDFADRPDLCFLLLSFLPLSCCIKIEFPELKAPPSRLNMIGLGPFSGPLRIQNLDYQFSFFGQKASDLLSVTPTSDE